MRTSLDIEDDVLLAAKDIARRRRSSGGRALSDLAGLGSCAAKRVLCAMGSAVPGRHRRRRRHARGRQPTARRDPVRPTHPLDVNVLLALADPQHIRSRGGSFLGLRRAVDVDGPPAHHGEWVRPDRESPELSQPSRRGPAALELLRGMCVADGHTLLGRLVSLREASNSDSSLTHGHVTDVSLALAVANGGRLATSRPAHPCPWCAAGRRRSRRSGRLTSGRPLPTGPARRASGPRCPPPWTANRWCGASPIAESSAGGSSSRAIVRAQGWASLPRNPVRGGRSSEARAPRWPPPPRRMIRSQRSTASWTPSSPRTWLGTDSSCAQRSATPSWPASTGRGFLASLPPGVDGGALLAALKMELADPAVTLVENDGTAALVTLRRRFLMRVEDAAAREFISQMLTAQGMVVTDEVITQTLPSCWPALGGEVDIPRLDRRSDRTARLDHRGRAGGHLR